MKKLIDKAYAKINLMLRVIKRRDDGYHDLQMLNAKIDLYDTIEISKVKEETIEVVFEPHFEVNTNNIVKKIASYMKEKYQIKEGMSLKIKKQIPIGAGLGGGSTDGALVIHLIDKLYRLNLSNKSKEKIASIFGADIPYCLYNNMAIVSGKGEKVNIIDYHLPYLVIIIYPKILVSTQDIFKEVRSYSNELTDDELKTLIESGQAESIMHNDLEPITLNKYPQIKDIINYLSTYQVKKVMMTGSGSTIFILIDKKIAYLVFDNLKNKFPNYYIGLHRFIKK